MIIGHFTYDDTADSFQGTLAALGLNCEHVDIRATDAGNSREPDYRITTSTSRGEEAELGAGWKRTSSQGRNFVSVTLDSPWLPGPINAALFTEQDGEAALVWTRPKTQPRNGARSAPQPG